VPYGKPISLQLADNELLRASAATPLTTCTTLYRARTWCVNPGIVAGPVHPDAGALIHLKSLIRRRE
jgi:hypothetical protein